MSDEFEMTSAAKQPVPPAKSYRGRPPPPQTLKLHEGFGLRSALRNRRKRWRTASKPIYRREASTNATGTAFEALSQTNPVSKT